jgi:tellurite resistance protein
VSTKPPGGSPGHDEKLLDVSDHAKSQYGLSAASATAMRNYGYALLTIAGADGKVSPKELDWLIRHQRTFGASEDILAAYAKFDFATGDLGKLLVGIVTDVQTWDAAPNLVYHAVQMCAADGTYAANEKKKVLEAAKTLKVPGDTVLTIHALVDMETATAKMRRALFHVDTL